MRKVIAIISSFLLLFLLAVSVRASSHRSFKLPENARQIAPNVYDLGIALDKEGRPVQGLAIIHPHHEVSHQKGDAKGKGGKGGSGANACYSFLARSAQWKTTEDYYADSTSSPFSKDEIKTYTENGMSEWENYAGFDIFGSYKGETAPVEENKLFTFNDYNEIMFGSLDSSAIAVAIVWITIVRPQIVEYDIMFNDYYNWGDVDKNGTGVMDYWNIVTHELGHGAGLGDLYNSTCYLETMYGYADYGETIKRDLHDGDITGIKNLYK